MDITYLGHSCFKIKGKVGSVVTDPFDGYVGFSMPNTSADLVTISHHHKDHDAVGAIKTTSRRAKPFIVDRVGEYEVADISVFGVPTWHDAHKGAERGENIIFTIVVDGVSVCHLGDLGHMLSAEQIAAIGSVDIVLVPVGGNFTINAREAVEVIQALDPSIVIPMHYNTPAHDQTVFADVAPLENFLKEYGVEVTPTAKLTVEAGTLPEERELVVLAPTV